ncbi:MAG: heparinase II/III family protein [Mangrovibacterium sp.]
MKQIKLISIVIVLLVLCAVNKVQAWEKRDLLQRSTSKEQLKSALAESRDWVLYPAYKNRVAWDNLTAADKDNLVQRGNLALAYQWKVATASDYLEFNRSGARSPMEKPLNENCNALVNLVLAELAEGNGRFLEKIADGSWFFCEMTSWAESAHIEREQAEKTSLPSFKDQVIDLAGSDIASFLAWTYFLLKDELDTVQPLIAERLKQNLQTRILNPYMERTFWWMAAGATPETMVNNWNPWCNFNVLTCFLLVEDDPDKQAEGIYKTMQSVDKYINYAKADGACEEGSTYWGHGAGKLYDYLSLLQKATGGQVSLFGRELVRDMGEFIVKSYVGDGWVVNFADASAKFDEDPYLVFRYGKAVESTGMQQFASYLYQKEAEQEFVPAKRDFYRTMESLACRSELAAVEPALVNYPAVWYPQSELCYLRNSSGYFFAAKGGYNDESHNHNDVGSFILYLRNTPLIIDVGVGTYTKDTFSDKRYSIWTMQSNYHNLPVINGFAEEYGAGYRSRNVNFDVATSSFSIDLARAYPENAEVREWKRDYRLDTEGLTIDDSFVLNEAKQANQLNFLICTKPDLSEKGMAILEKNGVRVKLAFNPTLFEPVTERIQLDDNRLSNVWGAEIYRLSLKAKTIQERGKYIVKIQTMKK